jgi:bloom syndrome protein
MLTSPISPTKRTKIPKNQLVVEEDEDDDSYGENDFVVSDDEGDEENALEIIRQPKRQLEMREPDFGIPITADSRLDHLPLIHQGIVHNFVHEARSLEERIRNNAGLRKPLFTETQLREMAIDWTLNLVAMKRIPGINIERVQTYGKQFIPLVKQFFDNYKEMMDNSEDRDIDSNHQNVIDLCSDEEAQAEEDAEYGSSPDSDDEAAIQEAEQHSVYFQNPAKAKPSARKFNSGSKKNYRAGSTSSGSKGQAYKRKSTLRKSYGSASGASVSGVRKRKSFTKKPRANKSNSGNTSKISNLTKEYGYSGGSRGGGMGGGSGISMMPT